MSLEVHKQSSDTATAQARRNGALRHVGSICVDFAALDKSLRKPVSLVNRLHVAHGSEPCGFVIWRDLTTLVTDCEGVASSMIPKRADDRVNTDRRNALQLARLLRDGNLTAAVRASPVRPTNGSMSCRTIRRVTSNPRQQA